MRINTWFSCIIMCLVALHCSQPSEDNTNHLGEANMEITGSSVAQKHFQEGLLLLHSFEYDDAASSFKLAYEQDEHCLMALWGEAMTYNHPLWRQQDREAALECIKKGQTLLNEKSYSEYEKDWWQALEDLYLSEGGKKERDAKYAETLQTLSKKYPKDLEIKAFSALAILGAVKEGRDQEAYEMGARIAQGVMAENPNHPGALHYLIHSYDDPDHAHLALPAANSYAQVAPDASHALHMPSHIFVALGMWDEVIASNIDSWNASAKRKVELDLDENAYSYHALNWLQYGLLQKGRVDTAKVLLLNMQKYATQNPSKRARDYLVAMTGGHLIEANDWDRDLVFCPVDIDDLNISSQAAYHFYQGQYYFLENDLVNLNKKIGILEEAIGKSEVIISDESAAMCSAASSRYIPNQSDINQAKVMLYELKAFAAQLAGNKADIEKWFLAATQLEDEVSYSFGPPVIINPSYELFASWLLAEGRKEEAKQYQDQALHKGPKRQKALALL